MLIDQYGRTINYLRISLTDRCNLRCVYCLPTEGVKWQERKDLLSVDEIIHVADSLANQGLKYIRLTGGEPLVHPEIVGIVSRLASLPGIQEVSLTTNAMLLEKLASSLAWAGLKRVNISLDTLDAEKFKRITRGGSIEKVWRGIHAATQAGLVPIKLNTVIINGLNDDELVDLASITIENPLHVRFIELMPVGNSQDWGMDFPAGPDRYLPVQEMFSRLSSLDLQPASTPRGNGPSRTFRIPGALGTVGFISPLGEHFCKDCNRLRLTADGFLRPCLLQDAEFNVRETLSAGASLLPVIQQALDNKPEGHELYLNHFPESRRMAQIGG